MNVATGPSRPSPLIATALLGVAVSLVNYLMPDNGISRTPGALLVIVSTAALALVGVALRRRFAAGLAGGAVWHAIAVLLLAGTAFAAWLLESYALVVVMALAACAWLYTVFGGTRRA